ncbi:hypothetical protein FRC08_005654 [Ceratobasidium sp. 394]|nr:hypothetical protein FRC08_005654 [Ceratobasidium sp. 394]
MRPFFFVASLFALASAVAATSSGACERGYELVPKNGKCVCQSPWYYGTKPPKPGCTTVIKRHGYEQYCEASA